MCGYKGADLGTHLKTHGLNSKTYKEQYGNDSPIKCKKMCDNLKGDKNPGYNHGGKFSPFSENFLYASEEYTENVKKKAVKSRVDNNSNTTTIEYWLKKTDNNLEDAKVLLSNRQKTFSLDICISKYGDDAGRERWLDRQEKWHKNYKKSNFSKISQDLFWLITDHLDTLDDIYFAQLDENKQRDLSGKNNEMRLKLDKVLLPDFIDTKHKKIIEFDGVYWHGKVGRGNKSRDEYKDYIYISNGYKVLHVNENEFIKNKISVIDECVRFLKQ